MSGNFNISLKEISLEEKHRYYRSDVVEGGL
jgi:hypothetical protein